MSRPLAVDGSVNRDDDVSKRGLASASADPLRFPGLFLNGGEEEDYSPPPTPELTVTTSGESTYQEDFGRQGEGGEEEEGGKVGGDGGEYDDVNNDGDNDGDNDNDNDDNDNNDNGGNDNGDETNDSETLSYCPPPYDPSSLNPEFSSMLARQKRELSELRVNQKAQLKAREEEWKRERMKLQKNFFKLREEP